MNLPIYIERTYPGVWPDRRITAPCTRDDGRVSYRDYTPLKSLQLKPAHVSEYEYTETLDGRYPSTESYI
jgi:hypothetical protein